VAKQQPRGRQPLDTVPSIMEEEAVVEDAPQASAEASQLAAATPTPHNPRLPLSIELGIELEGSVKLTSEPSGLSSPCAKIAARFKGAARGKRSGRRCSLSERLMARLRFKGKNGSGDKADADDDGLVVMGAAVAAARTPELIPWHRVESYQLQSLSLITQQMLWALPAYAKLAEPPQVAWRTHPSSFSWSSPHDQPYTLYASVDNPGAVEVARRLAAFAVEGSLICPDDNALNEFTHRLSAFAPTRQTRINGSVQDLTAGLQDLAGGLSDALNITPAFLRRDHQTGIGETSQPLSTAKKLRGGSCAVGKGTRGSSKFGLGSFPISPVRRNTTLKKRYPEVKPTREAVEALFVKPSSACYFVLYLNMKTFIDEEGDRLAAQLRTLRAYAPSVRIIMVHEQDEAAHGCEFDRFFHVTPPDLVREGLYRQMATPHFSGGFEVVSHAEVMRGMGMLRRQKTSASLRDRLAASLNRSAEPQGGAASTESRVESFKKVRQMRFSLTEKTTSPRTKTNTASTISHASASAASVSCSDDGDSDRLHT